MKLALACTALLVSVLPAVAGERAKSPADATVLIRLVGSVRAELDIMGQKDVITRDRIEIGSGSGFVISPDGHVLTNEHVVSNSEITVQDGPLRKAVISVKVSRIEVCYPPESIAARGGTPACAEASISAVDPDLDLAVLYAGGSNQPYLAFGDSDVITSGQPVQALGFPFGRTLNIGRNTLASVVPEITTTVGTISALRTNTAGERGVVQIDANINPGNSGGPLVNEGWLRGRRRARSAQRRQRHRLRHPDQSGEILHRVARAGSADADAPAAPGRPAAARGQGHGASSTRRHGRRIAIQVTRRDRLEAERDRDARRSRDVTPWTLSRLEQELSQDADVRARLDRDQREPDDARWRGDGARWAGVGKRAERRRDRRWPMR